MPLRCLGRPPRSLHNLNLSVSVNIIIIMAEDGYVVEKVVDLGAGTYVSVDNFNANPWVHIRFVNRFLNVLFHIHVQILQTLRRGHYGASDET